MTQKLPAIDKLLAHREDGLSDRQIAALYGVYQSSVSAKLRRAGLGKGVGSTRKLPPIDEMLARRAEGMNDAAIAAHYGVTSSSVAEQMRRTGNSRGRDYPRERHGAKLPPAADLARDLEDATYEEVAARYDTTPATVRSAFTKARKRGLIDGTARAKQKPRPRKPKAEPKPKRQRTTLPLSALDNTPRVKAKRPAKSKPAPKPAPVNRGYIPPDLTGLCAARELFGSRVCDLQPHDKKTAHEGAGPNDPRAEFWGAR